MEFLLCRRFGRLDALSNDQQGGGKHAKGRGHPADAAHENVKEPLDAVVVRVRLRVFVPRQEKDGDDSDRRQASEHPCHSPCVADSQSGFRIDRVALRVDLRQATEFSLEDEIRNRSAQQSEHAAHEVIGSV